MRLLLIVAAIFLSVHPRAFADNHPRQSQRVQRICSFSSEGASSYFSEILNETGTAMKWLSVVEAMPTEMRLAFARELVGKKSGLDWVTKWKESKHWRRVVVQTLNSVERLWDGVEASLKWPMQGELQAWRAAIQHESGYGFIEGTIAIASISVLALPEEELKTIVSNWPSHVDKPFVVVVGASIALGAVAEWLFGAGFFGMIPLTLYPRFFSSAIEEHLSLKSYGRVLQSLSDWAKHMKVDGAQTLTPVSSASFEVQMKRIRTEGLGGLSKIDLARVALAEYWVLERDVATLLQRQNRSRFEQEDLGKRIRQYSVNVLYAAMNAASTSFRMTGTMSEKQLWADLSKTLHQRHQASVALLERFIEESFSIGARAQFLETIGLGVVRPKVELPLVEFFNLPVVLVMTSGLEIEGTLFRAIADKYGNPAYVQTIGPSRLLDRKEFIPGQGFEQHVGGYGTPVGRLRDRSLLEELSDSQLGDKGIVPGERVKLEFQSGVIVEGVVTSFTRSQKTGRLILITFEDCKATFQGEHLFKPSSRYDMGVGTGLESIWNKAEFQEE